MACPDEKLEVGGAVGEAATVRTRAGTAITGFMIPRAGAFEKGSYAQLVQGNPFFTHYQINGMWGWNTIYNNLHSRLPFVIRQTNWHFGHLAGWPQETRRVDLPGNLILLGDGWLDTGMLEPVFRHANRSTNLAFVDGHAKTHGLNDLTFSFRPDVPDRLVVNDERLWTSEPGAGPP